MSVGEGFTYVNLTNPNKFTFFYLKIFLYTRACENKDVVFYIKFLLLSFVVIHKCLYLYQ